MFSARIVKEKTVAAMFKPFQIARAGLVAKWPALFIMSGALLLSACSKPVEKAEEIRPVRAMLLTADKVDVVINRAPWPVPGA